MNFQEYNEHITPSYNRFPIVLDHGEGVYLFDNNNKKYLDFVSGIAVDSLGHNNKELKKVITDQLGKVQHISNLYYSEPLKKAAKALSEATELDEIFFTNSGAEAIECALKLARRHQNINKSEKATKIISMDGSFHGRTYAAVTATAQPKYHEHFGPMMPDIEYATYNDLDNLLELVGDGTEIAAILIEPIKGEGGIIEANHDYLKSVRKLCDEKNILLIFDEIQCGAGRSGKFLAGDFSEVKPDIITLAKGIGAGFPVGACVAKKEVGDSLSAGTHGSTYGGNPLACAVVDYVVNKINDEKFLQAITEKGEFLTEELNKLKNEFPDLIKDTRGRGLIQGIEFYENPSNIINKAIEKGLLLVSAANNTIRLVPPLIITNEEIKEGINIIKEVLKEQSF